MRNIFLLLLLSNICLGLWVYSQEKMAAEAALPRLPSMKAQPLLLLSELPDGNAERTVAPAEGAHEKPRPLLVEDVPSVAEDEPQGGAPLELALAPARERACFTLGPFVDATKSRRALRLLQGVGAQTSKRVSQEQAPYGYRVYIPPLSSRERAYQVADQLREAGIKDYFVITNPNDKLNGVSLGLFKQRTGAIKRVAQLRNMDYRASIEVRYQDKDIYWLDYTADVGLVEARILLEAGEGVAGMQHLARDCVDTE